MKERGGHKWICDACGCQNRDSISPLTIRQIIRCKGCGENFFIYQADTKDDEGKITFTGWHSQQFKRGEHPC